MSPATGSTNPGSATLTRSEIEETDESLRYRTNVHTERKSPNPCFSSQTLAYLFSPLQHASCAWTAEGQRRRRGTPSVFSPRFSCRRTSSDVDRHPSLSDGAYWQTLCDAARNKTNNKQQLKTQLGHLCISCKPTWELRTPVLEGT